jgi:hypothetical protein
VGKLEEKANLMARARRLGSDTYVTITFKCAAATPESVAATMVAASKGVAFALEEGGLAEQDELATINE